MNIAECLAKRIMVLDGAVGTMFNFMPEAHTFMMQSAYVCDMLCLHLPTEVRNLHQMYIEAGADIITTNTFNAHELTLRDTVTPKTVSEINYAGACIAKQMAEQASDIVYVAGSMGPGDICLSKIANTHKREVLYNKMKQGYRNQAFALMSGGVDTLLLETIIDTENLNAALAGIYEACTYLDLKIPVMLSFSLSEEGKLISGEGVGELIGKYSDPQILSIGLNCGYGLRAMQPYLELMQCCGRYISVHANAGLPDANGHYPDTAYDMAAIAEEYMRCHYVNIIGGCCGTTPEFIRLLHDRKIALGTV